MPSISAFARNVASRSLSSMIVIRVLPLAWACSLARCDTSLVRLAFEKSYSLRIENGLLSRGLACRDEADSLVPAQGVDDRQEPRPGAHADRIQRASPSASPSSRARACGSRRSVTVSSKLTPCFLRFAAALAASHSIDICIKYVYGGARWQGPGNSDETARLGRQAGAVSRWCRRHRLSRNSLFRGISTQ